MKATHIANGREIVRSKPALPPGYRTPPKSKKLAKFREKRKAHLAAEAIHTQEVRTLKEVIQSESRKDRKMRAGGISRMRNHR